MSKTIVLDDTTFDALNRALAASSKNNPTPQPTPQPAQPTPQPTPSATTRVVSLPWVTTPGIARMAIAAGETVAFAITPPVGFSTHGKLANFSISPTGGNDYFDREICLSAKPGDFTPLVPSAGKRGQEANVYFSVGGMPKYWFGLANKSNADLTPARTVYVNVRQIDPTKACSIDYGLTVVS